MSVSSEGVVTVKVEDTKVEAGTVTHLEDSSWRGDCKLCDDFTITQTKGDSVSHVKDHFLRDHTTSTM